MKKLFERKEMKYLLSKEQALALESLLEEWLVPDVYPDYEICSIYFDDKDWNLFRKSTDKPVYKEKLRLRSYGTPQSQNDPVFLEIKKKLDGIVYKRRFDCSMQQARDFLVHPEGTSVTSKEIAGMLTKHHLNPAIYIAYHRKAWTWIDDPDLRITIDDDIRYRMDQLDLQTGSQGNQLLDEDTRILEIKSMSNFPIVLIRTLKELGIVPASISKAGSVYAKLLEQNLLPSSQTNQHTERGFLHGIS